MSTIVLRSVKNSPLTNAEVDSNFSNLNTDKLEAATSATLTNKTINLTSNTLVATSAQLAAAVTDETGTGALVFANSPTLVTPALGTPASGVVTNLTGTASININGTVGATTANTGAFTTLAASGDVTLSGATANGVAFANGSKILTTGSALTFDGTNFNVVRAAATDQYMSLYADGTGPTLKFFGGAAGKIAGIVTDAASASMYFANDGNKPFVYAINGSEQMRLTSTGLGIGTSSPSNKLTVNSGASTTIARFTSTGSSAFLGLVNSGATTFIGNDSTSGNFVIQTPSGGFSTKLTLDNSGNLGLGVTPSAWGSDFKAIQVSGTGAALSSYRTEATSNEYLYLSNNSYNNNTNDIYIRNGAAVQYRQLDGTHAWFNAPSGTAGNAISFSQVMTLDASGNLLVGATSGSNKLTVNGNGIFLANGQVRFADAGNNQIAYIRNGGAANTSQLEFWTGATPSERARIDSSGNLLVGTTSQLSGERLSVKNSGAANNTAVFSFESSDDRVVVISYHAGSNGATSRKHYSFLNSGTTEVGSIACTGSATAYNTSSDYRLKNTIAPMTGALAKVALLKPCTYKWNADGSDGEGFIAHELAEVVPQCVTGEKDAVDAEGKPQYQGIDTSFLVATLTAAIQELKAEFDAYKASHP